MENLILTGTEAPCFINFDNVDFFYLQETIYEGESSFETVLQIKNHHNMVEDKPEAILLKLKKNKFVEIESGDYKTKDHFIWNMANGKFYININSILMVEQYREDTSLMNVYKSCIEVKGTVESIYLKLKNL